MTSKKWSFPSEEELKKIDKKLARAKGSAFLPPDASPTEKLKWELCAHFIRYRRENDITQRELADTVGISEARMSEILRYRYKRYTLDHLFKYLLKIKPDLKIKVA